MTIITIAMTISSLIITSINEISDTESSFMVQKFSLLFDIYSNFGCIMLSYTPFNQLYYKLCDCMDMRCRVMWSNCVGVESKLAHINSVSTNSGSTTSNL